MLQNLVFGALLSSVYWIGLTESAPVITENQRWEKPCSGSREFKGSIYDVPNVSEITPTIQLHEELEKMIEKMTSIREELGNLLEKHEEQRIEDADFLKNLENWNISGLPSLKEINKLSTDLQVSELLPRLLLHLVTVSRYLQRMFDDEKARGASLPAKASFAERYDALLDKGINWLFCHLEMLFEQTRVRKPTVTTARLSDTPPSLEGAFTRDHIVLTAYDALLRTNLRNLRFLIDSAAEQSENGVEQN